MTGGDVLFIVRERLHRRWQPTRRRTLYQPTLDVAFYTSINGGKPARTYTKAPMRRKNPLERADYQPTQRNPVAA